MPPDGDRRLVPHRKGRPVRAHAGEVTGVTPAEALARAVAPGPEGLAEQFAFKVAAGLFGRDLRDRIRPIGAATHLAYGSLWGGAYGLLKESCPARSAWWGPAFGLLVYGVGPGFLVPAMHLMRSPREEPPARTALLVAGHILYGVVAAKAYRSLAEACVAGSDGSPGGTGGAGGSGDVRAAP